MRLFAWGVLALLACSAPERTRPMRVEPPAQPLPVHAADPGAPGLRLPDDITPVRYDLTLDVDPDSEIFLGEVRIRVRVERATDRVWIHADQLDITSARYTGGELTPLAIRGDQMLGFGFGRTVAPGEMELMFAFKGRTTGEQEGLFRQQTGGRWYVFSQGESVFARRITPCFDEPKFKTPWRVTLRVPRRLEAFANAPEASAKADERTKLVTFEDTPPMPSYLLAIAVGPFDVVTMTPVGSKKLPVRVAVRAGAGKQVGVVDQALPALVAKLEDYIGAPLPLAKLDLVAVPEFFGAMENPGLITFESNIFVGKDTKQRRAYFTYIAAHELAHQWFGNSVTMAWWDDLWLSESFASWLGDKMARAIGALDERPLHDVLERRDALTADASPNAVPLRRPIAGNGDPEDAFDAIAYQKGQAVLATFEALIGEDAFRDALRGYLRARREGTTTTADLVAALTAATSPDTGKAFEQYATQVGAPMVDVALRCDAKPAVIATARDQRLVPMCVRYAGGKAPLCALVGARTELSVGGTCPAWVDANPRVGYYTVHWRDRAATQWLAKLEPAARVMIGDDLAAVLRRGDLGAKGALAELRTLLGSSDAHAQIAAQPLAEELDALVDDATRPAWSKWLVKHLPRWRAVRKHASRDLANEAFERLMALFPPELARSDVVKDARTRVDKMILADTVPPAEFVAFAAVSDGDALFERVVTKARSTLDTRRREEWLGVLGAFPPRYADRTAALVVDMAQLPPEPIWDALVAYFARPSARTAAWRALRTRLDTFIKRAPEDRAAMIAATATLCDRTSRDEVATAFTPHLGTISDGRAQLDRALASIDACIARRTQIGDLGAAIAGSPK